MESKLKPFQWPSSIDYYNSLADGASLRLNTSSIDCWLTAAKKMIVNSIPSWWILLWRYITPRIYNGREARARWLLLWPSISRVAALFLLGTSAIIRQNVVAHQRILFSSSTIWWHVIFILFIDNCLLASAKLSRSNIWWCDNHYNK